MNRLVARRVQRVAEVIVVTGLSSRLGWRSVFVASGSIGFVWAAVFSAIGSRSPAEHKCVSEAEREVIHASRPPQPPHVGTPWRRIATCRPFLALVFTHCAFNWTG